MIKIFFKIILFCCVLIAILFVGYLSVTERPFRIGTVVVNLSNGVGNQLFQYAAGYSLAKKTNSKLYVISQKESEDKGNINVADRNPALNYFHIPKENYMYRRKLRKISFIDQYVREDNFFELLNKRNFRLLIIDDLFASAEYFQEYKGDLIKLFTPNIDESNIRDHINQVSQKNSVCIHIRGGDTLENKDKINLDYQKKAIELTNKLINDPQYFVFSDSIDLVKKELEEFKDLKLSFIHKLPLEDFAIMCKCRNIVIANSSFSWWAAYLNQFKDSIIVAPAQGLYNRYSYPKEWIQIK